MITIFHEPINIRAKNVARIEAAAQKRGVQLKTTVFATPEAWQRYALDALHAVERIALELDIQDRLHSWPDSSLGSKIAIESQPDPNAYRAWLHQRQSRISEWPKAPNSSIAPAAVGVGSEAPVDVVAEPATHILAGEQPNLVQKATSPPRGNVESVESPSENSTIPRIPQGGATTGITKATTQASTALCLFPREDRPLKIEAGVPAAPSHLISTDQPSGDCAAQLSIPGADIDTNIKGSLLNEPVGADAWKANLRQANVPTLQAVLAALTVTEKMMKRYQVEHQIDRRAEELYELEMAAYQESIANDVISRFCAKRVKINVRMMKKSCIWDYRFQIRELKKYRCLWKIFVTRRHAGVPLDEVAMDNDYDSIEALLDDLDDAAGNRGKPPEYPNLRSEVSHFDVSAIPRPMESYLWKDEKSVEPLSQNSTTPPVPPPNSVPVDSATPAPASCPADMAGLAQKQAIPATTDRDILNLPVSTPTTVADYYPPDSLVARFVEYCCHQIESAQVFMVAGALTLLSIKTGRSRFIKWGDQTIYPNLMQVLLAPSGARKTQLISIVTAFANELCPGALLADTTSHERLVECLAEESTRAMIYPEGKTLIDLVNRSPELTTDFIKCADCEQVSTEFKSNEHIAADGKASCRIVAAHPYLPVLIGIVSQGLNINAKNLTNGFLGRFMFFMAEGTERDILSAPPVMTEVRTQLVEEFRRIAELGGEMYLTAEATVAFTAIQQENRDRLRANPPEAIASNLNRMPFFTLRVAMLFQLAMDDQLAISESALRSAQRYVELQHRHYCEFVALYAADKTSRLQKRILTALERCTPAVMPHSRLFNRISTHGECNASAFHAALAALEESEKIRFVPNYKARHPDVMLVDQSPARGLSGIQ